MHIILGLLGTIITILILINRLSDAGLDIGWLNPFSWQRRRRFRQQYLANPAYSLESTMDAAALLMISVAKIDGDMSKEQKDVVLQLFMSEFSLSEKDAKSLLSSSVHIYGKGDGIIDTPQHVLKRSAENFTEQQLTLLMNMLNKVASAEGEPSKDQLDLIARIENALPKKASINW